MGEKRRGAEMAEEQARGDATDELVAILREAPRSEGQITSIGRADADDEDSWRWFLYTDAAAVARCESAGDARHIMECWNSITDLTARLNAALESSSIAESGRLKAEARNHALADALRSIAGTRHTGVMPDCCDLETRMTKIARAALAGQPTSCPNQQRVDEVMKIVDEAERRVNLLSEALRTLIDSDEYLIHARTECDCYAHNGARAALHEAPTGGE